MKSLLATLNVETFILDLRQPLAELPTLDHFKLRKLDDTTLSVDVAKTQSINELFSQLSGRGIEVMSMRNKANRLEELVVRLLQKNDSSASAP